MENEKLFTMSFAKVYPLLVNKAERKGRTKAEVDTIIYWLTGYDEAGLNRVLMENANMRTFFTQAPQLNEKRTLIKGSVCKVKVELIEDPLLREIRYLDKLIDELAKGKALEKILRS